MLMDFDIAIQVMILMGLIYVFYCKQLSLKRTQYEFKFDMPHELNYGIIAEVFAV